MILLAILILTGLIAFGLFLGAKDCPKSTFAQIVTPTIITLLLATILGGG